MLHGAGNGPISKPMIDNDNQHIAKDLYYLAYTATFSYLAGVFSKHWDLVQMTNAIQDARAVQITEAEITAIRVQAWADANRAFLEASRVEN